MSWIWPTVLSNSAVASGLAVVALLVGRSPRRAATAHLVWLAVLVKLLTPPLLVCEWPASSRPEPASPGAEGEAHPGAMPGREGSRGPVGPGEDRPVLAEVARSDRIEASAVAARDRPRAWGSVVGWAWAVLSLGLAGVAGIRLGTFRRRLASFPRASEEIRIISSRLAKRLGLTRVPEVRIAPGVLPPLVWSLGGPPVVVLPARLVDRWGPDGLETVLAHELAHVRRGDHLVRFLELACAVALPWHPLVWLATRRLRDLEERCCDARVLEVCPDRPRAYALALVATLEFLGGRRVPAVPLRTAIRPAHPLARRIAMLGQTPPRRLTAPGLALVAGLVAAPLALTFAQAPTPTPPGPVARPEPTNRPADPAVVRGRVVDKAGAPVADARVRLAIPAADMRFAEVPVVADASPHPAIRETRTDGQGRFEFTIPDLAGTTEASFDVLKPGFRRLASTLQPDDARQVEVGRGRTVELPLTLIQSSRYYRGVVVDEAGRPIVGVRVRHDHRVPEDRALMLAGDRTTTNADGTFELFSVDLQPHRLGPFLGTSEGTFSHPDFVPGRIDDLHALPEAEQGELRVVLKAGRSAAGTVLDVAGRPVVGALVAAEYQGDRFGRQKRKATLTDGAGKFALRGLADGPAKLKVQAFPIAQKRYQPLPATSRDDLTVRLEPLGLPADLMPHDVLGMKLADVTPAVRAAFDLEHPNGAVILDPGANSSRLGIGELAAGDAFWWVGGGVGGADQRRGMVRDVRDFVARILAENEKDEAKQIGVCVAYAHAKLIAAGDRIEYLRFFDQNDLSELRAFADRPAK